MVCLFVSRLRPHTFGNQRTWCKGGVSVFQIVSKLQPFLGIFRGYGRLVRSTVHRTTRFIVKCNKKLSPERFGYYAL